MRNYPIKLDKAGISRDRYEELRHFCLQYEALSPDSRHLIDSAAQWAAGEYAPALKANICRMDTPYRFVDIPFSETQFKRIRREFFIYLDKIKEK